MAVTFASRRGPHQTTANTSDVSCVTLRRSGLIDSPGDPRRRSRKAIQEGRDECRRRHLLPGESWRVLRVARAERGWEDHHDLDPYDDALADERWRDDRRERRRARGERRAAEGGDHLSAAESRPKLDRGGKRPLPRRPLRPVSVRTDIRADATGLPRAGGRAREAPRHRARHPQAGPY